MHWYDDLIRFFPKEETRVQEHFAWLLKNRPDIYRVDATEDHVLLFLEYSDLLFIDYLFVYPEYRGQGIGTKVLRHLKQQNKGILLEVEPIDHRHPETSKRQQFYRQVGFQHADFLTYRLESPWTGTGRELEIFYWTPHPIGKDQVYNWMARAYHDLYMELDPAIYGRAYPAVTAVLQQKS